MSNIHRYVGKRITIALIILAIPVLCVGCKRMGRGGELEEKYGAKSVEMHLYDKLGIDPELCKIVKVSEEGKTPVYEVTTDHYGLGEELTFHVYEDSSTSAIGSVSIYWSNDVKDCLFDVLYPIDVRSRVFNEYNGYSFWIDPLSFEEDIEATADALEEIKETYEEHGFGTDMIPWMHVEGKFVDTERVDGITVSSKYVDNVPKELIYQALFEMKSIKSINSDSYGLFESDNSMDEIRKRYLSWAMEDGLIDIYLQFSYKERLQAIGAKSSYKLYYAVVDGVVTDESEEIYSDHKGNLPISSFYKLLKRQGWDVEGDWYHYKLKGIDGKEYEFGYDQCGLAADPVSSRSANKYHYSRTFNNYYYVCDGQKYRSRNHLYDGKVETRLDVNWDPVVYRGTIELVTGWEVTSTYDKNK
ncbi:hypothetical protein [Butyrivibrio sp. INlla16]|uniref:hypothetical protein n=1 Tax=Butyrivibrio sp. INlla16 TaxID=1520807 RepID=UPI00088432D2|nr:hypothetical protein [Butyrivibrio sp. INlla16]SDB13296.1 hypothetical protein SAMN02910263_00606 [Butyrivibrio sp. INlla16]